MRPCLLQKPGVRDTARFSPPLLFPCRWRDAGLGGSRHTSPAGLRRAPHPSADSAEAAIEAHVAAHAGSRPCPHPCACLSAAAAAALAIATPAFAESSLAFSAYAAAAKPIASLTVAAW